MLSNREKWLKYTEGLSSPQNFVEWSWRSVIAAALQRRVAFGGDPCYGHMPLFANMYVVLVGKAGIGKGIVINPATELLRFHKKKDFNTVKASTSDQEKIIINEMEKVNQEDAEDAMTKMKGKGEKMEPTLFPYAPDATTYEALVTSMSKAGRRINFTREDKDKLKKLDIYYHCSMYFSLPELGSLLRKRTDDTVNYLLGLYDCPLDYEYKTKTKGEDRVRRGCLNLLAGTTPDFMETVFDQNLIDQGFSSRTFFVYAQKNRKHVFTPEQLTEEQKQYRLDLLAHIKELAKLYGEVKVAPETLAYLKEWWQKSEEDKSNRSNISAKLDSYYARKNIHIIKVAMVEHFSDSLEMEIPSETFKRAIAILEKEEKNMHMALTFDGENPLGKVSEKVVEYIRNKKSANMADLMTEFWRALPRGKVSMKEVLDYLIMENGTVIVDEQVNEAGRVTINYKLNI